MSPSQSLAHSKHHLQIAAGSALEEALGLPVGSRAGARGSWMIWMLRMLNKDSSDLKKSPTSDPPPL